MESPPSLRPVLLVVLLFLASVVAAAVTTGITTPRTRPSPVHLVRAVVDQPATATTSAGSISP